MKLALTRALTADTADHTAQVDQINRTILQMYLETQGIDAEITRLHERLDCLAQELDKALKSRNDLLETLGRQDEVREDLFQLLEELEVFSGGTAAYPVEIEGSQQHDKAIGAWT